MILEIRRALPEDAPLIHALTRAAYEEYRHTDAPSSALDETLDRVRGPLERGDQDAFVIEADGVPVASVRYKIDDEGLYFFRLGVVPGARGKGIAGALLERLEAEARDAGVERLWCQVRLGVPRNVRLYEGHGFGLIGRHVVTRDGNEIATGTMEKPLVAVARIKEKV